MSGREGGGREGGRGRGEGEGEDLARRLNAERPTRPHIFHGGKSDLSVPIPLDNLLLSFCWRLVLPLRYLLVSFAMTQISLASDGSDALYRTTIERAFSSDARFRKS